MEKYHIIKTDLGTITLDIKSGKIFLGEVKETRPIIPPKQKNIPMRKENTYHISLGSKCNLNCGYCNALPPRKDNVQDINTEIIDKAFEILPPENLVMICGSSEPLLNKDAIKYIREKLNTINEKKDEDKKVNLSLGTNATLLDEEFIDGKTTNFYSISIDGTKEHHEKHRGKNYDQIASAINLLNYKKSTENPDIRIGLNCVVDNRSGDDFSEYIKALEDFDPESISIYLAMLNQERPDAPSELLLPAYEKLADYYAEKIIASKDKDVRIVEEMLGRLFKNFTTGWRLGYRCYFDATNVMDSEGNFYPCSAAIHKKELAIGNINNYLQNKQKYMDDFLEGRHVDELDKCKTCWIRYQCGGPCYVHAFTATGDTKDYGYKMCDLIRGVGEIALRMIQKIILKRPELIRERKWWGIQGY